MRRQPITPNVQSGFARNHNSPLAVSTSLFPKKAHVYPEASRLQALSALSHSAQFLDGEHDVSMEDAPIDLESISNRLRAENSRLSLKLKSSSDEAKR